MPISTTCKELKTACGSQNVSLSDEKLMLQQTAVKDLGCFSTALVNRA